MQILQVVFYRSFFAGRLQVCQTSDLVYMKEKKDRGKYFKECSVEKERANRKRMSSRESIHERKEQPTCDPPEKRSWIVCATTRSSGVTLLELQSGAGSSQITAESWLVPTKELQLL